jgi:hypothetical protein
MLDSGGRRSGSSTVTPRRSARERYTRPEASVSRVDRRPWLVRADARQPRHAVAVFGGTRANAIAGGPPHAALPALLAYSVLSGSGVAGRTRLGAGEYLDQRFQRIGVRCDAARTGTRGADE